MQIRLMYKKVLYVFLSIFLVFSSVTSSYASPAGWAITKVASAGARVIVNATNSGYKSAVNIAPNVGRIAAGALRVGNTASLIYSAIQLGADGVDGVIDPANNKVKWIVPAKGDAADAYISNYCKQLYGGTKGGTFNKWIDDATKDTFSCKFNDGSTAGWFPLPVNVEKSLSLTNVSEKLIANAGAGHAASQQLLRDVATAAVIAGDFDADLLSGAVPLSDNKPLIPSVPGSQTGDIGVGTLGGGQTGADAEASREQADKSRDAAQAAKDAAKDAADAARQASDAAKDLIGSGTEQAIKDAADAKAAQATKDAADAQSVADAAANASAAAAAAAARDAAAAKSAADAVAAAAKAAAKAARENADATAEAIAAAEAKAAAAVADAVAAKEAAEAAAEAAKDAAAAKPEAKPFELPAFCSWAGVVCEYMQWVKEEYTSTKAWVKEEPVASPAELMPIDDMPAGMEIFQDKANAAYVSFDSQCPADVLIPVSLMGATQTLNISYLPFCHFASLIRAAVILGAWISGLLIISAGRARE